MYNLVGKNKKRALKEHKKQVSPRVRVITYLFLGYKVILEKRRSVGNCWKM